VTGEGRIDSGRILKWLDELIGRSCKTSPVLVGQLLGGAIAARYASGHSHWLRQLMLVDTFGLRPFQPEPEFGLALSNFLAQPAERTHTDLWGHCAFNLEALRHRMGERWQPFEAYNLDRARTPSVQAAVATLMERFKWPLQVIENCNDDPPVEQPDALLHTLRLALDGV